MAAYSLLLTTLWYWFSRAYTQKHHNDYRFFVTPRASFGARICCTQLIFQPYLSQPAQLSWHFFLFRALRLQPDWTSGTQNSLGLPELSRFPSDWKRSFIFLLLTTPVYSIFSVVRAPVASFQRFSPFPTTHLPTHSAADCEAVRMIEQYPNPRVGWYESDSNRNSRQSRRPTHMLPHRKRLSWCPGVLPVSHFSQ